MTALTVTHGWVPVLHYGASVRPRFTCWLIKLAYSDGETCYCCESHYGHRTRAAAHKCARRAITRRFKAVAS